MESINIFMLFLFLKIINMHSKTKRVCVVIEKSCCFWNSLKKQTIDTLSSHSNRRNIFVWSWMHESFFYILYACIVCVPRMVSALEGYFVLRMNAWTKKPRNLSVHEVEVLFAYNWNAMGTVGAQHLHFECIKIEEVLKQMHANALS